jgi:cytochrome c
MRRSQLAFLVSLAPVLAALSNEPPVVSIHVGGNQSFIWDAQPVSYIVVASDAEDGDSLAGSLDPYSVAVEFTHLASGFDDYQAAPADAGVVNGATRGRELVESDDCLLCHSERATGPTAIPTYEAIAAKFQGNVAVAPALAYNIINGSEGIWGNMLMPPHAATMDQAIAMAQYVLSFADEQRLRNFVPVSATLTPDLAPLLVSTPFGPILPGRYLLTAAYSDRGSAAAPPVSSSAVHAFRYANLLASQADVIDGFDTRAVDGTEVLVPSREAASLGLAAVDLSGIRTIGVSTLGSARRWPGAVVELRLDSPEGTRIGAITVTHGSREVEIESAGTRIHGVQGKHDLYFVVRAPADVAIGALCFDCGR